MPLPDPSLLPPEVGDVGATLNYGVSPSGADREMEAQREKRNYSES